MPHACVLGAGEGDGPCDATMATIWKEEPTKRATAHALHMFIFI
jgi:hypothetical protein